MKRNIVMFAILTCVLAPAAQLQADEKKEEMMENPAIATFAGGCFWCMEPPFDALEGVISTTSGYTGGFKDNPTYQEVSAGETGHTEALRVEYDPAKITYAELLEVFWRNIDPTTPNRQFCDVGSQYRPGVFYHDDEQKRLAEASRKTITDSGHFDNVAVEITEAGDWYDAEEYHQDFYKKNPDHYYRYRTGCRRDNRLDDLWKDFPGKITTE